MISFKERSKKEIFIIFIYLNNTLFDQSKKVKLEVSKEMHVTVVKIFIRFQF